MEPDIVPLCLYDNSHVKYPIPIPSGFKCDPVGLKKEFYVVNGDFRPVPLGMIMYCASGTDDATLSLEIISDIYNTESPKSCIRFIAWGKPVPNTIPITIKDKTIYVLDKNKNAFSIVDGRCIPHDSGKPLDQCVIDDIQSSLGEKPTLLNYLSGVYVKKNGYITIESPYTKRNLGIFLSILLMGVIIGLIKLLK
jgi:hypothetical protein